MSGKRKYRLNAEAIAAIRKVQKMVRERYSGDPYFDDVLAFDPASDESQPSAETKIRKRMGDVADAVGLAPDIAYAIRQTGSATWASTCWTTPSAPPGTRPSTNTTGWHGGRNEDGYQAPHQSPRQLHLVMGLRVIYGCSQKACDLTG